MQWMILPFKRYAEFSGRSRRLEYWMFQLLNVLVTFTVVAVAFLLEGGGPAGGETLFGLLFGGVGIALLLFWLAAIIPGIAVTVRRLHDREMSGWWMVGFIVLSALPLIGILASIAYFVVMALPGTQGDNKYGADPKGANYAEVFG